MPARILSSVERVVAIVVTVAFVALGGLWACASSPRLGIAHFAADDARVDTAGFVGETTQIHRTVGATRFTLMVFAVGETLTLGAMVRGPFTGTAHWSVGEREFSVAVDRSNRGADDVPVNGGDHGEGLRGQHGGFRDFDWVNVDVPCGKWLREGATSIRLEFDAPGVEPVVFPAAGATFEAVLTPR